MNFKEYVARLVAAKPEQKLHHGLPQSRRELINQGFLAGGAFVLTPSLLSIVSTELYGEEECKFTLEPYKEPKAFYVDLGGGNCLASHIVPLGKGGKKLSSRAYRNLAVDPGDIVNQIDDPDTQMGQPFNKKSQFFIGMMETMSQGCIDATSAVSIPNISNDDSPNNPLNPGPGIAQGDSGLLVSRVGSNESASGGKSLSGDLGKVGGNRSVQLRNVNGLIALVTSGVLTDLVGKQGLESILKFLTNLSQSQLKHFNANRIDDGLKHLIKCGVGGSKIHLTNFEAEKVNPRNDSDINELFLDANGVFDNEQFASIAQSVMQGYARFGTIERGGNDYHGNGKARKDEKDLEAGRLAGSLAELAFRKNEKCFVGIGSDGSTNSRENEETGDDGRLAASSDHGESGLSIALFVNGNGSRLKVEPDPQVGWFIAEGGGEGDVDPNSSFAANSSDKTSRLLTAHFFAAAGRKLKELESLTGLSRQELEEGLRWNRENI